MSREEYDDFTVLSRLADGRLTAEELERIEERLFADAEFRRRYVGFMGMDFELAHRIRKEIPVPDLVTGSASPRPAASPGRPARSEQSSTGIGSTLLKLVAVLALGVGAWIAATYDYGSGDSEITATPTKDTPNRPATFPPADEEVVEPLADPEMKGSEDSRTPTTLVVVPESPVSVPEHDPHPAPVIAETAPPPKVASPAEIEAEVLGSVWSVDDTDGEWKQGVELAKGEHSIARGTMEMRLNNGVRLVVEGPTRFALKSLNEGRLISGKLAAEVNYMPDGFRVNVNSVSVVDLGTRFAVTANDTGDAAVHVYDGIVSATVEKAGTPPLSLRTGQTMRLDLSTNRLVPIRFRPSMFASKPAWTGSITEVSKNVSILDPPPGESAQESLRTGKYVVFKERSGEVLKRRLAVDIATFKQDSGKAAGEGRSQAFVPADSTVTSYLVQRFPAQGADSATGEGFLRFDSPVLGIIFTEEHLFGTDSQLGARRTKYLSRSKLDALNRGGRGAEMGEVLGISSGGREVRLRFNVGGASSDAARIIVAHD